MNEEKESLIEDDHSTTSSMTRDDRPSNVRKPSRKDETGSLYKRNHSKKFREVNDRVENSISGKKVLQIDDLDQTSDFAGGCTPFKYTAAKALLKSRQVIKKRSQVKAPVNTESTSDTQITDTEAKPGENEGNNSDILTSDVQLCSACKLYVDKKGFSNHIVDCLKRFRSTHTKDQGGSGKNILPCEICKQDLSNLSHSEKISHYDHCMEDHRKSKVKNSNVSDRKRSNEVLGCPICGQKLKTFNSRKVHLKKCAKQFNIPPALMQERVRQQENEFAENGPKISTQSIPDDDTALALALSRSLINDKDCKNDEISRFGDDNHKDAISILMSSKQTSKPTKRKKKKDISKHTPLLLRQSMLDANERLAKKVAEVVDPVHAQFANPLTPSFKRSQVKHEQDRSDVWRKSNLFKECNKKEFYVSALNPPIQEKLFSVGDKNRSSGINIDGMGKTDFSSDFHHDKHDVFAGFQNKTLNQTMLASTQTALHLAELLDGTCYEDFDQTLKHKGLLDDTSCLDDITKAKLTELLKNKTLISVQCVDTVDVHASEKSVKGIQCSSVKGYNVEQGKANNSFNSLSDNIPSKHDVSGFFVSKNDKDSSDDVANRLIENFLCMVGNPLASDMKIKVKNDRIIPAHAFVIASRCPNVLENFEKELDLCEFSEESVLAVLRYLYAAVLDFGQVISEVFHIAKKLHLEELIDYILKTNDECNLESNNMNWEVDNTLQNILDKVWGTDDSDSENDMHQDEESDIDTNLIDEPDSDIEQLYEFMALKKSSLNRSVNMDERNNSKCEETDPPYHSFEEHKIVSDNISDNNEDIEKFKCQGTESGEDEHQSDDVISNTSGVELFESFEEISNEDPEPPALDTSMDCMDPMAESIKAAEEKSTFFPKEVDERETLKSCEINTEKMEEVSMCNLEEKNYSTENNVGKRKRSRTESNDSCLKSPKRSRAGSAVVILHDEAPVVSGEKSVNEIPLLEISDDSNSVIECDTVCDNVSVKSPLLKTKLVVKENSLEENVIEIDNEQRVCHIPVNESKHITEDDVLSDNELPDLKTRLLGGSCRNEAGVNTFRSPNVGATTSSLEIDDVGQSNKSDKNECQPTECSFSVTSAKFQFKSKNINSNCDIKSSEGFANACIPQVCDESKSKDTVIDNIEDELDDGILNMYVDNIEKEHQRYEDFDPPTDMSMTDTSILEPPQFNHMKTPVSSKNKSVASVPSPFTPMPAYDTMQTPLLKKQCNKYGVRVLPKKKMIGVLKDIYERSHQYETDSESENPSLGNKDTGYHASKNVKSKKQRTDDVTVKKKSNTGSNKVKKVTTQSNARGTQLSKNSERRIENDCNESEDVSDSLNSSFEVKDSDDLPEESFISSQSNTAVSKRDASVKRREVYNYIETHEDVYLKILHYEPLEFDEFHQCLKKEGIVLGKQLLMDCLDDKCIQFSLRGSRKPPAKKERKKRSPSKKEKTKR